MNLINAKEALLREVWTEGRAGNIAAMIDHVAAAAMSQGFNAGYLEASQAIRHGTIDEARNRYLRSQVGSHGNLPLSEASTPAQSAAPTSSSLLPSDQTETARVEQIKDRIGNRLDALSVRGRSPEAQAINDTVERALAIVEDEINTLLVHADPLAPSNEQEEEHRQELLRAPTSLSSAPESLTHAATSEVDRD